MTTPFEALVGEAQGLMYDTISGAPDVPDEVWKSVLPNALRDFSRYSPLRKLLELQIASGDLLKALPADFISVEVESFNRAVNPLNSPYTWRGFVFALQSTTSAASDLPSYFSPTSVIFQPGTCFRFLDDGSGGKRLAWNPAAAQATTLAFDYQAKHAVTDEVITVPDAERDLLLLLMCKYACRALARQLAGDKNLKKHYSELAGEFGHDYENRTRFAPIGVAG